MDAIPFLCATHTSRNEHTIHRSFHDEDRFDASRNHAVAHGTAYCLDCPSDASTVCIGAREKDGVHGAGRRGYTACHAIKKMNSLRIV